ncbi:CocE/NonD family hydrolase [Spongisporangium articulatum]|uniref:CocE/NonD family hydrolase n=1 Tax=Spongisporangium articulatum TaxID=3362603 RepID=A0ABW8ANP8_9ACTN
MSRRIARAAVAVLVGAALAVTGLSGPASPAQAAPELPPVYKTVSKTYKMTMRDGIVLTALVVVPKGVTGKQPLVLIPSAWGGEKGQMQVAAGVLAKRGMIAINYATRGFKESQGQVELAGPNDIHDVSDLIDWAGKNVNADTNKVGMFGLSYGAGLSLLASAYEPRLKAVGSLEGFSDLPRTATPNGTRATVLIAGLWFGAVIAGKLSPELKTGFQALLTGKEPKGTEIADALASLKTRSPLFMTDAINKNHPAVYLATSWNDIAYGTDQMTEFYNKLTVPKRLEIRPGDHVINEVPGAIGVGPATVEYDHLYDWMQTYLMGQPTSVTTAPPVWIKPRSSGAKPANETYPNLAAMTTGTQTLTLTAPTGLVQPTGGMTTGAATSWTTTLKAGGDVAGGLGAPIAGFAQEALTGRPPSDLLWATDRSKAALWVGPKQASPLVLRGDTTVSFTIVPSATRGTLVAYLYDSDAGAPGGTGYLISHRPYTFKNVKAGQPLRISFPLQPTAYNVPAGHRLAVGLSTGDPVYASENPKGSTIRLVSSAATPLTVTSQLGK